MFICCIDVYIYIHIYIYVHCIYIYTYRTHIYIYIYKSTKCIYIYIYIYVYVHYIYIHTGVDLKDHVSVVNSQCRQCYNVIPRESDFLISRKFIFWILECPFENEV